jgi:hypothetical protein
MRAGIHLWWHLVSAAARATLIDLGSKRLFCLLLIWVFCAIAALRAYRASENKRWATIRNQWTSEIRDVFIVIFLVGVAVFGYEFMNQSRLRQVEDSLSNHLALFNPISTIFPVGPTNVFPAMAVAPSVFRFFGLKVSQAGAISYLSNRWRPHHRLFTSTALPSAKASTIQFRTVLSW